MNRKQRRHSGMVYLTVLSVSMIVTVIGVGAILVTRQQRLATEMNNDLDNARMAARSGVELARNLIAADPAWRTTRQNGTWQTSTLRGMQVAIAVTDPADAVLSNCYSDPVLVTCTGTSGSAQQIVQMTLAPELKPLGCLAAALTVNGSLIVKGNGLHSDGLVSCNNTISGGGQLNADAEAFLITALGSGNRTILSAGRAVPATTVFDYYTTFGTLISRASIPGATIKNVTISATSNPYGAVNARGIYVIDCQGGKLTIQDATINATLVLINLKNDSVMTGTVVMTGPASNAPALLVNGSFTLNTDKYPAAISGLIYVSGDLTIQGNCTTNDPIIVGGDCTVSGGLWIGYDPSPYNRPPEGFYQLPCAIKPVPGTWKPAVN